MSSSVFLSYASEDLSSVKRIYDYLNERGVAVWFDKESLRPGQRWEREIQKAIRDAEFFLVVVSKNSVDKKGVVQSEISTALKELEKFPHDKTYMIPLRIDDSTPSQLQMSELQWVDLFTDWEGGLARLLRTIAPPRVYKFSILSDDQQIGPQIPVRFTNSVSGEEIEVYSLIDTGSDSSMIPKGIAEFLKVQFDDNNKSTVIGISGIPMEMYKVRLNASLINDDNEVVHTFEDLLIDCPGDDTKVPLVLIGRDMLGGFDCRIDFKLNRLTLIEKN